MDDIDPGLIRALDSLCEEEGLTTLSDVLAAPDDHVYAPVDNSTP